LNGATGEIAQTLARNLVEGFRKLERITLFKKFER
jgi:hypothetical protein